MRPLKPLLFLLIVGLFFLLPFLANANPNPRLVGDFYYNIISVKVGASQEDVWYSGYWMNSEPTLLHYDVAADEVQVLSNGLDVDPYFDLSPNEQFILFTDPVSNNNEHGALYRLPALGGTPTLLVSQTLLMGYPDVYAMTPDSQTVIFLDETSDSERLYAVPMAGGALVELTAGLPTGVVDAFELSPTGTHVYFTYDTAAASYLVVSAVAGGTPLILNPDGTMVRDFDIEFAPDGNSLFFQYDDQFMRADIATGMMTPIGMTGGSLQNIQISPDGAYLFYDWQPTGGVEQIYRLTLSENALATVSTHTVGQIVSIAPVNDTQLFYVVLPSNDYSQLATLYSVAYEPLAAPVALAQSGPITPVEVSSDGEYVVYNTRVAGQITSPVYVVKSDGSAAPVVLYPHSDGRSFKIAPSNNLVYITNNPKTHYAVYVAPITGGTLTSYFERDERGLVGLSGFLSNDRLLMVDFSYDSFHFNSLYLLDPLLPAITPTPTITRTPTITITPSETVIVTATQSPTITPTPTFTPIVSATVTATVIPPLPTVTPTGSLPPMLTPTATATPNPTVSTTATVPTVTATASGTPPPSFLYLPLVRKP